ncbi:MAG: tagaturonate reductase [Clostridia bacterium]|nr:tagaturonate reductase [Clostridia bacterium]
MKEKIIQFGTGNFLRGFFADFVQTLREKELFDGDIVIVQPTKGGKSKLINEADGNYNLYLRGVDKGEQVCTRREITCVSRCVDPYNNYDEYLALAKNPDLRFIVSNTTEAGIEFNKKCNFEDRPALSFPGKLTQLLYQRYLRHLPGFVILPCELISDNGKALKKCVLKYAAVWELGEDFSEWIENENTFCNTLVDRIVTGFPEDARELYKEIGREDKLLNTAEPYHLWVIEGDFENELPLKKAGLNVIWSDDVAPYKKMKVRILNGSHTSLVFPSLICGVETVKQSLDDEQLSAYLNRCLFDTILPLLEDKDEIKDFAAAVLERFANPYIKHRWQAISLNSVSKFKERVLPSIEDYILKNDALPKPLVFALSCLIYYYKNNPVQDNPDAVISIMTGDLEQILADSSLWGIDLSAMKNLVEKGITLIETEGVRKAIDWAMA